MDAQRSTTMIDSTHASKLTGGALPRVLLADDDTEFTDLLGEYLRSQGFAVDTVHDGHAAVARASQAQAIVLDIMMPGLDGLEVLRTLRAQGIDAPVLMLTARGEDVDRIVGLELGADDYLAKPANPRELVARLRAVLRRLGPVTSENQGREERVGAFVISRHRREVLRDGTAAGLTGMEFEVFCALADAAGSVVSKEQISQTALARRLQPMDRSVDVHISNLRSKLGADAIKTVRGRGYQLVI